MHVSVAVEFYEFHFRFYTNFSVFTIKLLKYHKVAEIYKKIYCIYKETSENWHSRKSSDESLYYKILLFSKHFSYIAFK